MTRRLLFRDLGLGVGLLVAWLAFQAGRSWQRIEDLATHIDVTVAAAELAGVHCLLGR